MAIRRILGFVFVILVLSLSVAVARTWTSSNGKFTIEATLVDYKDGQVTLKKDGGGKTKVPLASLSDEDRDFVKQKHPNASGKTDDQDNDFRQWRSLDGKFNVKAKLVDSKDDEVCLEKTDGRQINVPIKKLSLKDRSWLRKELTRRGIISPKTSPPKKKKTSDKASDDASEDDRQALTENLGSQAVEMQLIPLKLGKDRRGPKIDPLSQYAMLLARPQMFFVQTNRGKNPYEARFQKLVTKEPKYNLPKPFQAVARIGSDDYAFAVDAVGKEPKGFNRLYFDLNHNGDLTDDKPIDTKDINVIPKRNYASSSFPPFKVPIQLDDGQVESVFMLSVMNLQNPSYSYTSASLRAAAIREGTLKLGRKNITLVLIDHNSNGRFDDRVAIQGSGSRLSINEGDLLLINPNTKDFQSGVSTTNDDCHFVGRTICAGTYFYKLDISPSGNRLTLEPTQLGLGYVTNASPMYRAVLYNDDYGVVMVGGVKDQKTPLPEGEWKIAKYAIDATAFTGKRTIVEASFSDQAKPLTISKNKTVELTFGAPFRPVVTAHRQDQGKKKGVSLNLSILGAGGERCTNFYVNGKKPPEPAFEVRDADGKVVSSGKFEYG